MSKIKITSKRQATLPVDLCREMGIKPGDEISVEKRIVEGQRLWTLSPKSQSYDWFGSLKAFAQNKSHDLADIRRSIGKGVGGKHPL